MCHFLKGENEMVFFSKTRGLVMGIGFLVIGIGLIIYGTILSINLRQPPVDLYNVDWNTLHANQHVEMDVDFLMDCYMEYEKDGKVTSAFYVMPEFKEDEEGLYFGHFMGVAATSSEFAKFDTIVDKSYEWWGNEDAEWNTTDLVHVDGYLRKMSANDKKYMTEYLQEIGYSDEDIKQLISPYVLMKNKDITWGTLLGGALMAVVGGVFLAITIIRMVRGR